MMRFICFLNWTDLGVKTVKDAVKHRDASKAVAEKLGGRVISGYVTAGQYDVVLTLEMPNGDAMAQFALSISQSGLVRTTTARAFQVEEFAKLAAAVPAM